MCVVDPAQGGPTGKIERRLAALNDVGYPILQRIQLLLVIF
jgi:hypothetical protein